MPPHCLKFPFSFHFSPVLFRLGADRPDRVPWSVCLFPLLRAVLLLPLQGHLAQGRPAPQPRPQDVGAPLGHARHHRRQDVGPRWLRLQDRERGDGRDQEEQGGKSQVEHGHG